MILSTLGTTMVITSVVGLLRIRPTVGLKRLCNAVFFNAKGLENVKLRRVTREGDVFRGEVTLPYGITDEHLERHLKSLEQATASTIKYRQLHGPTFELKFGFATFHSGMNYHNDLPQKGLSIPLFTPFGLRMLDFGEETNCHLLVGGATRMGKSVFLRLIATHLINATNGKIKIVFIDNKITDLYPFKNLPQVQIAETSGEARAFLMDVKYEIARRKELLKSKGDVVDLKELRERYPNESVGPLFVIIDEYGRFSDDEMLQEIVVEIAETAGYVDVHLILSSQRPDAKDVLKPRIKANIVTRVAFATSDETNSKIILDLPDAAHIGKVKGRAVLLDGFTDVIQVPYITAPQAVAILNKYRRVEDATTGPEDCETIEALPSFVAGSTGFTDLS